VPLCFGSDISKRQYCTAFQQLLKILFKCQQEYLDYSLKLKKSEEKFERLKEHSEETLEKVNREMEMENLTRSQVRRLLLFSSLGSEHMLYTQLSAKCQ